MRLKAVITLACALILGVGLLAACAPPAAAPSAAPATGTQAPATAVPAEQPVAASTDSGGGTLHMGKEGAFEFQLWSWQAEMWQEDGASHNALLRISHDMAELLPDLAIHWEVDEEGTTYTFHLRDDVRWHDGESFTADDVVWTYNTLVNPNTGTIWGTQWLSGIVGYDKVMAGETTELSGLQAIDDHTLQITFVGPAPTHLWILGYIFIFPEHLLGDVAPADLKAHPYWTTSRVGTGPYKFESYSPKQSIVYVRNDDFWGERPNIDRIIFHIFDNAETALIALEKGEIDTWAGYSAIPINEIDRFREMPHINVLPGPSGVTQYIMINQTNPDFPWGARKEFRQALAHCVDKQVLSDTMWAQDYADIQYGPVLQARYINPDLPRYEYDPAAARALLESIDYAFDAKIDLNYYYAAKFFGDLMAVIQAQAAECGIQLVPALLDGPSWAEKFNNKYKQAGGAMLGFAAHGIPLFPDDHFILFMADFPEGRNVVGWHNETFKELARTARASGDEAERTRLYFEIQEMLADELPYIWLWHPHRPPGVNARVQNSRWGPTYVPYYQGYQEWSLSE